MAGGGERRGQPAPPRPVRAPPPAWRRLRTTEVGPRRRSAIGAVVLARGARSSPPTCTGAAVPTTPTNRFIRGSRPGDNEVAATRRATTPRCAASIRSTGSFARLLPASRALDGGRDSHRRPDGPADRQHVTKPVVTQRDGGDRRRTSWYRRGPGVTYPDLGASGHHCTRCRMLRACRWAFVIESSCKKKPPAGRQGHTVIRGAAGADVVETYMLTIDARSLPLDGAGRLGGDVVGHPVDPGPR